MSTSPATRSEPGFNRRLMAYVLGGSTLALTGAAHAAVVWSGVQNLQSTIGTPTSPASGATSAARVNPADNTSVQFGYGWVNSGNPTNRAFQVGNFSASSFNVIVNNFQSVSLFSVGDSIGAVTPVGLYPKYDSAGILAIYNSSGTWTASETAPPTFVRFSNWSAGGSGYVGFRFGSIPTGPFNYGWMEVSVPTTTTNGTATIVQWAYESNANTPITVGDTGAPVPEPGSIALVMAAGVAALLSQPTGFAVGAAGLRAWRRRRQRLS